MVPEARVGPSGRGASGGAGEVFLVALRLGLTSFGGPVAHLGYFERAYVRELGWLSASEFAHIVALCQLAPGPASSQAGFLIGVRRAGWAGGLAAWLGFTLPSAVLMTALGLGASHLTGPLAKAVIHGLKLAAVPVVAQAALALRRAVCPDLARLALAAAVALLLIFAGSEGTLMAGLAAGALAGAAARFPSRLDPAPPELPIDRGAAFAAGGAFLALLTTSALLGTGGPHTLLRLCALFYRSGALVFGGGHVVLPLLRDALVPGGWLGDGAFLSGYGAAQALPGPLFAFAAYVGAAAAPPGSAVLWAGAALACLFAPGLLVVSAALPFWRLVQRRPFAAGALAGVNAAVLGALAAALWSPVWTTSVRSPGDALLAAGAFLLLAAARAPPIAVVAVCVAGALGLAAAGRP